MSRKKWRKCMSGMLVAAMAATTVIPAGTSLAAEKKYTETDTGKGYVLVTQEGGKTLGYSKDSGVTLLEEDGYAFKDLNRNGKLDVYEDWRKSVSERAANLAELMTQDRKGIESIAGLMLYSGHQKIPGGQFGTGTYDGQPYDPAKNNPWDLADGQITFLRDDNLRHVLLIGVESPEVAAKWNNTAQAFVEGLNFGIPINSSSDPRHDASGTSDVEYQAGAGGEISKWPSSIGMTATFDPDLVRQFGSIASTEYRALGIATALSPQIDLATEPRWSRVNGTFGENSKLSADLSRAYVDGFQTTYSADGKALGWGEDSVNAMVKHWPSGGPEEGGRDGHYGYGKYAVYPGNNFEEQLVPFTEGAFKLSNGTGKASAVMPYYTISYNQDTKNKENVGNGFSEYLITDLLRGKYNYDNVVCTDWMITADTPNDYAFSGKCWGVENLTVVERHYKVLMAGVDQFGGNNESGPVMGAYDLMVERKGKTFADKRFADSARRLLTNIFNTGLFENPYLDPDNTKAVVGNKDYMAAGYNAQLKSVVMVKNKNNVIAKAGAKKTAYVVGVSSTIAEKFYNVTDDPAKADIVIVGMNAPKGGSGYSQDDLKNGGNGYVPITLQYGAYTATAARDKAIANSPNAKFIDSKTGEYVYTDTVENRSYKGKTVTASNASELDTLKEAKKAAGDKPVVVYMKATNPMVWSEVEPLADAIVIGYGIQDQAALQVVSGNTEPSGLLPMQQPANMETVEKQYEDVPQDMECYKDAQGNTYDFGFGLNWSGKISDARTAKYVDKKQDDVKEPTAAEILEQVKVAAGKGIIYVGGNTGKTTKINVTLPAAAAKATVTYAANNKKATVSANGKVTARKKGSTVITTTVSLNGASKSFKTTIKVKKASIKITRKKASLKAGKKFTFKAKGYGVKNIRWSIKSGKKYASVKAKTGKFTAKKAGKVTVLAKAGKVKKTVKVTVK